MLNDFYQQFCHETKEILDEYSPSWITAAVSGGVDSITLLHSLVEFFKNTKTKIHVLTFNHGIRKEAKTEVLFVQQLAKDLNCSSCIINLNMSYDNFSQNRARELRRAKMLEEKKGELVFLGQHLDDQLETVYMRLGKNSGFLGLAGISPISNNYARPLLKFSKKEIINQATLNGWKWSEDPTNQDTAFTRNYIRQKLFDNKLLCAALSNIQQNASVWRKEFKTIMATWCEKHISKSEPTFAKPYLLELVEKLVPVFTPLQNQTLKNFALLSAKPETTPNIYVGAIALQYIVHHISQFKKERHQKYRLAYKNLLNNRNFTVSHHLFTIKQEIVSIKKE